MKDEKEVIAVRVSPELKDKIREIGKKEFRSITAVLKVMMLEGIERRENATK